MTAVRTSAPAAVVTDISSTERRLSLLYMMLFPSETKLMDLTLTEQPDWALLSSGDGRKLERFGSMVLERPAPQAVWDIEDPEEWECAQAIFQRRSDGSGDWRRARGVAQESWTVRLFGVPMQLRFTGFGNVGVFPEHAVHWPWMEALLRGNPGAEVLNLFSYTGGASIFCAEAGARVTHVDAAKSVNAWAQLNARYAGPDVSKAGGEVRLITDDAVKFVRREARRGRKYRGIILDPPTFGRGAKGEVWKVDRDFVRLMEACREVLHEDALFTLVTSHSPGITPAVLRALLRGYPGRIESGEMLLSGKRGPNLPAGAYARVTCAS